MYIYIHIYNSYTYVCFSFFSQQRDATNGMTFGWDLMECRHRCNLGGGRQVFLGGASQGCTMALDVYIRPAPQSTPNDQRSRPYQMVV